VGVDGVDAEEYEENLLKNLGRLVERMKKGSYKPQPVRRVYIPKDSGGKRPLGIPSLEDKIVQMGITRLLEAMFEPNFLPVSYGYRKGRSCHTALAAVEEAIKWRPVNFLIDADIKGFFDNVDHRWMLECLKQRVADKNLLRLIVRFLKAGIMEEGKYFDTEKGTPQGGVLSPVLSNIYLHYVLDLWLEKKLKPQCKGYVSEIRYCDDFILCVQIRAEAEKILKALGERLQKFRLSLSEEKTRLIGFGRNESAKARHEGRKPATFDFLGITHYCDRTLKGKFKVGRRTSRKKFKQKIKEMNQWLKRMRCRIETAELWKHLKVKLEGHYRYYGVSANCASLYTFYYKTVRLVHKWLNRRSQRRSFGWERFLQYLQKYPLPEPRLYHDLYAIARTCEGV
jgi:group II intron reverse transcriptase/maturase